MKAERALGTTEQLVWIPVRVIARLEPRVEYLEARLKKLDTKEEIGAFRAGRARAEAELARAKALQVENGSSPISDFISGRSRALEAA